LGLQRAPTGHLLAVLQMVEVVEQSVLKGLRHEAPLCAESYT
jgi:hypothetical protein